MFKVNNQPEPDPELAHESDQPFFIFLIDEILILHFNRLI